MTAHELAAKLLEMPDVRVTFFRVDDGSGEMVEVEDITINDVGLIDLDGTTLPDRVYAPDTQPRYRLDSLSWKNGHGSVHFVSVRVPFDAPPTPESVLLEMFG